MLSDAAADPLCYLARAHHGWQDRAVTDGRLAHACDLLKWGPTSANGSPARFVWGRSAAEKARLLPCMAPGNRAKVAAPVTALIGMAMAFYGKLPQLSPAVDARAWFADSPALAEATAFRNSSLQGACSILAARAIGLDCGPMSGFDAERAGAAVVGGAVRGNFVYCIAYGDPAKLRPRTAGGRRLRMGAVWRRAGMHRGREGAPERIGTHRQMVRRRISAVAARQNGHPAMPVLSMPS